MCCFVVVNDHVFVDEAKLFDGIILTTIDEIFLWRN